MKGMTLKQGEVAGYNDDRGNRLKASQDKEKSLVNELKKAGVIGDDFGEHIEKLRLDPYLRKRLEELYQKKIYRDAKAILGSSVQ